MKVFKNLKQLLGLYSTAAECMIVCEQEGAEIWLQGQKTEFKTPCNLKIPLGREVQIELKQIGHESKKVWIRSTQLKSFYYCDLNRIPLRIVKDELEEENLSYSKNTSFGVEAITNSRL